MNRDSGVQFVGARPRKRHHREISSQASSQPARQNGESSNAPPRLSVPPLRYTGDGLDFRHPVTASPAPEDEVIDLTNEPDSPEHTRPPPEEGRAASGRPRPPRFGREIMTDIVDLEDEPDPPSSPEVQFLSANVRRPPAPPPPQQQLHPLPPRNPALMTTNFWNLIGLTNGAILGRNPGSHVAAFGRRQVPWEAHHLMPPDFETLWIGDGLGGAIDLTIGLDVEGMSPDRQRPVSAYKPPSPPPDGFTRSAGEEDVVCCPNCDAELGVGGEVKQQIWVAKQCGHVYCGECATNRSASKAKKSNSKTKPFSKCQVSGCEKVISSPRSMFQVYL